MTQPAIPPPGSPRGSQLSRAEVVNTIQSKQEEISDAIQNILREAGLHGLNLHSLRFTVAHDSIFDSTCDPPCSADEDCVIDCNGREVKWVCVPR